MILIIIPFILVALKIWRREFILALTMLQESLRSYSENGEKIKANIKTAYEHESEKVY